MRARMTAIGFGLLGLVALEGAAWGLTIGDLVAARGQYDGKVVTVSGKVERPLPVGPTAGTTVTVTGTVYSVQQGDGGPEDITFPVVIRETARQP
jgi:hypothetical protein